MAGPFMTWKFWRRRLSTDCRLSECSSKFCLVFCFVFFQTLPMTLFLLPRLDLHLHWVYMYCGLPTVHMYDSKCAEVRILLLQSNGICCSCALGWLGSSDHEVQHSWHEFHIVSSCGKYFIAAHSAKPESLKLKVSKSLSWRSCFVFNSSYLRGNNLTKRNRNLSIVRRDSSKWIFWFNFNPSFMGGC